MFRLVMEFADVNVMVFFFFLGGGGGGGGLSPNGETLA